MDRTVIRRLRTRSHTGWVRGRNWCDRRPRPQLSRRSAAIHSCDRCRQIGSVSRHARDRSQEPLRIHCRFRLSRAAGRAGYGGVRRHRAEPHGRRHQRRRGRSHGPSHRRLRAHRLDADVRFREPGSHLERNTPVRLGVEGRRTASRGEDSHRRHCQARPRAGDRSLDAGRRTHAAARGASAGCAADDRDARDQFARADGRALR